MFKVLAIIAGILLAVIVVGGVVYKRLICEED